MMMKMMMICLYNLNLMRLSSSTVKPQKLSMVVGIQIHEQGKEESPVQAANTKQVNPHCKMVDLYAAFKIWELRF
jgi:hypothetical protein